MAFVAGTWSVSKTRGTTTIELAPAGRLSKSHRAELEAEADGLAVFIAREQGATAVRWSNE